MMKVLIVAAANDVLAKKKLNKCCFICTIFVWSCCRYSESNLGLPTIVIPLRVSGIYAEIPLMNRGMTLICTS
ncbi:MAG: hypothetical protein LBV62_03995 [Rickettsiales bacterium]|jgi:hypothetical protein|nr:hypothetical protein [Rickettsiales bacterium]